MDIRLIVGLGNPGHAYRQTRHNIGFRVVDALAEKLGAPAFTPLAENLVSSVPGTEPAVLLVKPQRFMNRSGAAISSLATFVKLVPTQMLVIVDDVDLPLGRLRLRPSGGPGSHNGMRDLVDLLGPSFPRLRIGVRDDDPWEDLAQYVLAPFPEDQLAAVTATIESAVEAVELLLAHGISAAMNQYNRAPTTNEDEPTSSPDR